MPEIVNPDGELEWQDDSKTERARREAATAEDEDRRRYGDDPVVPYRVEFYAMRSFEVYVWARDEDEAKSRAWQTQPWREIGDLTDVAGVEQVDEMPPDPTPQGEDQ